MFISYKNKTIEKICTDFSKAKSKFGQDMAQKIHQRVNEISASPNVDFMIQNRIGRCHSLKGDRAGQYAVDLVHPFRLVFSVHIVTNAIIIEIVDYH